MSIGGSGLTDTNIYFRLLAIVFAGTMVFGVLISWRAQLLFNAEYVEFPMHRVKQKTDKTKVIKKSVAPVVEEVEMEK
jgi:hypothetical protein